MNEGLKILVKEMNQNTEFSDKMKNCKSVEEAYQLASSVSTGYSQQEFVDFMKEISKKREDGELTESDLDHVAGGLSEDEWMAIGGFGISVAAAAYSAV